MSGLMLDLQVEIEQIGRWWGPMRWEWRLLDQTRDSNRPLPRGQVLYGYAWTEQQAIRRGQAAGARYRQARERGAATTRRVST